MNTLSFSSRRSLIAAAWAMGVSLAAPREAISQPPSSPPGSPPAGPGAPTMVKPTSSIPVRQLGRIVSSDSTILMGIAAARHLATGGVLVNDASKRQLVVFDSTLQRATVIADTSTNSPNSYGLRGSMGGLVPYVADSTLFIDSESYAFLVINPRGEFTRIMAPARAFDLFYIASGAYGGANFDPKGRMVYRTLRRPPNEDYFFQRDPSGKPRVVLMPDSAPILRMDFDKRTVDTIALIKIPVQKMVIVASQNYMMQYDAINPLPVGDEWTLMPDGTVAIVRGQDYHMDWLSPDGKLTSSPKMPFDWRRLPLEEKQAMIDSLKKENAEREAKAPPPPPPIPGQPIPPRRPFITVEPNELPDYYPAVRQGQVRADPAGYVWILPSTSAAAKDGLLYDVVDRNGEIVERVQLPKGRTLVGFGPNRTIYMNNVIAPNKSAIERATVVR